MSVTSTIKGWSTTTKVVVGAVAVLVTGFVLTKVFKGGKGLAKRRKSTHNVAFFVGYLANADLIPVNQVSFYMNKEYDFLDAWYDAARKDQPTFKYDGKTYNVKGGQTVG